MASASELASLTKESPTHNAEPKRDPASGNTHTSQADFRAISVLDGNPDASGNAAARSLAIPSLRAPVLQRAQRHYGNRFAQRLVEKDLARRSSDHHASNDIEAHPSGGGQSFDVTTRQALETHFQADLSDVRVHTDFEASESAHSLDASAYALGRDIYFGAGLYSPGTDSGRRLLAHEVAHVVQQGSGAVPSRIAAKSTDGVRVGAPDDPLEAQADIAAEEFVAGESSKLLHRSPSSRSFAKVESGSRDVLQRQPAGAKSDLLNGRPPFDPVKENETPRTAVQLQTMTNDDLLYEIKRLKSWLAADRNQPAKTPSNAEGRLAAEKIMQQEEKNAWNSFHSQGLHERNWKDEQAYRKKQLDLGIAETTAIIAEKKRRVGLGYLWWSEPNCNDGIGPAVVYQLLPLPDGRTEIVQIPAGAELGEVKDLGARPQMTPEQFDAYLKQQGAAEIDANNYSQLMASLPSRFGSSSKTEPALDYAKTQESLNRCVAPFAGTAGVVQNQLYLTGLQRAEAAAFTQPSTNRSGNSGNWIGQRGEFGVKSNNWLGGAMMEDFNNRSWVDTRGPIPINHPASSRNFPLLDLRSRTKLSGFATDSLLQVKVSARADANQRFDYFAEGLGDIFGARSALRTVTARELNTSVADLEQRSLLVVNADDAAAFANALRNPTGPRLGGNAPLFSLKAYRRAFDAFFDNHPVRITASGPLFRSTAALEAALRSNAITQAQFNAALEGAGATMAQTVVANPKATTASLQSDAAMRQRLGTPEEAARVVSPELLPSLDAGGGMRGSFVSALGGAPRAGAAGAGIAVLTDFGLMILDRDNAGAILDRLPHDAGMGALGGTTGAVAESVMQSQLSQYFLQRAVAGTLPAEGAGMFARSISRKFGGGVGAAAVEAYEMISGNAPAHSGLEAGFRITKAASLGAVSTEVGATAGTLAAAGTVALLSGEAGAAAGSVVPVVGTVVGFVVGVAVGGATYYVLNEAIMPLQNAVTHWEANMDRMATDWAMQYINEASMGMDPMAASYMNSMYPPTTGIDDGN